jgi:uncharacterized protein involved in exopolysaccharide biosynthesis
LAIFSALGVAVISVAVLLPDLYRGTASVLVERELDLAGSPERPEAAGELEMRLQTISQKVLSRSRLDTLIQRFDLYQKERSHGATAEAVVVQMRRDIHLELKGADPAGAPGATVAFALSYWGRDRNVVAQVANALATSYVEDNLKSRELQAAATAKFLKIQLAEAKAVLDETSDRQASLAERRDTLAKRLSAMEPTSGPTAAATTLATLKQELNDLLSRYKPSHPEVLRVQKEIKSVESQLVDAGPVPEPGRIDDAAVRQVKESLAAAESRLLSSDYATARDRYLSLVKSYEQARLNQSLEQDQQGDQFAILDAAVAQDQPAGPNRIRILLAGMAVAIGAALGGILWAEHRDTSFHAVGDLREFTRVPILASIPHIATTQATRQHRRRVALAAFSTPAVLVLVVGVSYLITRWAEPLILALVASRT